MIRSSMLALAVVALAGNPNVPAHAADAPPAAAPGRGIRYVYLIRHGDYLPDSTDPGGGHLNPLGHVQARAAGARLAALPVHVTSLVTSTYTRARESAADIGAALEMEPVPDSLIHECTPNADRPNYIRNHPAAEIALCDSSLANAWRKYFVPSPDVDSHVVLVCHGNVIRWLVSRALGMDTRHWPAFEIGNGSLTIVAVFPDGGARLVMFSDVGHLPLDQQTWTGKGPGWGFARAAQRPATSR